MRTGNTALATAARNTRLAMRPAAMIFDMDGLMLDTEPLAARAWTDAASAIGVAFDEAVKLRLVGRNFPDCERLLREHHGHDYLVADLMQDRALLWISDLDQPRAAHISQRAGIELLRHWCGQLVYLGRA